MLSGYISAKGEKLLPVGAVQCPGPAECFGGTCPARVFFALDISCK